MDKIKAFYKIGRRKAIPLMVTEQEAQVIKELNRDFDRQYKADITYHKRTISMDKLMLDESMDLENKDLNKLSNTTSFEEQVIEKLDNEDFYPKLYKAIDEHLTPRQKKLLQLIIFEQKPQVEIAHEFGVSDSAISQAMSRIYATLKKFFIQDH